MAQSLNNYNQLWTNNIYATNPDALKNNQSNFNDAWLRDNPGGYTAGGKLPASFVYDQIQQEKAIYDQAKSVGDTAAMDAAHKRAEAWRATAGYSGGSDGSQLIALGGAGIGSMGTHPGYTDINPYNDNGYGTSSGNGNIGSYYVYYGGNGGSSKNDAFTPYEELIQGVMSGIQDETDDITRELYQNYMKNMSTINEKMGAYGLLGSGMQESSMVDLGNVYQEYLANALAQREAQKQEVRMQVAQLLQSGAITDEQAQQLFHGINTGEFGSNREKNTASSSQPYAVVYNTPTQTQNERSQQLSPTLSDSEMYAVLKAVGIPDSVIGTYFTPNQAAPSLQDILIEQYIRDNPIPVQQSPVNTYRTGNRTAQNSASSQNSSSSTQPITRSSTTSKQNSVDNSVIKNTDFQRAMLGPIANNVTPLTIAQKLNTIENRMNVPSESERIPGHVYQTARNIARMFPTQQQQQLNQVISLRGKQGYSDQDLMNLIYLLGLDD